MAVAGGFVILTLPRGQMPTNLHKSWLAKTLPCRAWDGDQLRLFPAGFRPACPPPGCKGQGCWAGVMVPFFSRCVSLCRESYSFPVFCADHLRDKMDEREFIHELRAGNKVYLSSSPHSSETQLAKS